MSQEYQGTFDEVNAEYATFVEKFKPKKTTDDCYTPPNIFEAVADWAARRFGFAREAIVRPFWPGGDYERYDYPAGCVVVDNPPFSIIARIERFYLRHGIPFFLFAPGLSLFKDFPGLGYVIVGQPITFENGAEVNISFVTSLLGDIIAETAPDLGKEIERVNRQNLQDQKKVVKKLALPVEVLPAANLKYMALHGIPFRVLREDTCFIRKIANLPQGFFGAALMLSPKAAAERAAAERAAAERAAAERAAAERAAAERAAAERAAAERAAAERAAAERIELTPAEKEMQAMIGKQKKGELL